MKKSILIFSFFLFVFNYEYAQTKKNNAPVAIEIDKAKINFCKKLIACHQMLDSAIFFNGKLPKFKSYLKRADSYLKTAESIFVSNKLAFANIITQAKIDELEKQLEQYKLLTARQTVLNGQEVMSTKLWLAIVKIKNQSLEKQFSEKQLTETDSIPSSDSIAIGKYYKGGIIFYIDPTGKHGLIAAQNDQSSAMKWYNGNYIITNARGKEVGMGQSNTSTIIAEQGSGTYAASICDNLELNGYTDWYLPSIEELKLLYLQKNVVLGFADDFYWSSTGVANYENAFDIHFRDGQNELSKKYNQDHVRAVRSF